MLEREKYNLNTAARQLDVLCDDYRQNVSWWSFFSFGLGVNSVIFLNFEHEISYMATPINLALGAAVSFYKISLSDEKIKKRDNIQKTLEKRFQDNSEALTEIKDIFDERNLQSKSDRNKRFNMLGSHVKLFCLASENIPEKLKKQMVPLLSISAIALSVIYGGDGQLTVAINGIILELLNMDPTQKRLLATSLLLISCAWDAYQMWGTTPWGRTRMNLAKELRKMAGVEDAGIAAIDEE